MAGAQWFPIAPFHIVVGLSSRVAFAKLHINQDGYRSGNYHIKHCICWCHISKCLSLTYCLFDATKIRSFSECSKRFEEKAHHGEVILRSRGW